MQINLTSLIRHYRAIPTSSKLILFVPQKQMLSLPLQIRRIWGGCPKGGWGCEFSPLFLKTTRNNPLFCPIQAFKMIHPINPTFPKSTDSTIFSPRIRQYPPFSAPETELFLVELCPSALSRLSSLPLFSQKMGGHRTRRRSSQREASAER